MAVHHLNCGLLHVPPNPQAACHCLLIEQDGRLALVDTGIGLQDIARPVERIGQVAIDAAGFQFHEALTARRQIEKLGYHADDVADIVLTHADPDHAGGLADFPHAAVHVSEEEYQAVKAGDLRYSAAQLDHEPRWVRHPSSNEQFFGLEARPLTLSAGMHAWLIPLPGHTLGHCGVAIAVGARWLLHVGDAYYLRAELTVPDHPISALASLRAADDERRRATLEKLRHLMTSQAGHLDLFGYHDLTELNVS